MSKTIMPSKTLSKFDRQYLIDRGQNPDDFILPAEEETPPTPPATAPEQPENPVSEDEAETEDEDEEDIPYSEWTVDELEIELQNRSLKKSGNKDELIARLEEHDATLADGDA